MRAEAGERRPSLSRRKKGRWGTARGRTREKPQGEGTEGMEPPVGWQLHSWPSWPHRGRRSIWFPFTLINSQPSAKIKWPDVILPQTNWE